MRQRRYSDEAFLRAAVRALDELPRGPQCLRRERLMMLMAA